MSNSGARSGISLVVGAPSQSEQTPATIPEMQVSVVPKVKTTDPQRTVSTGTGEAPDKDRLLTAEEVAARLNVTKDWVWDHSSRKAPFLPAIRIGDGTLRYRSSKIEDFIDERERLTHLRRKRG